ncbi:hypothetical protein [Nonomuraea solani]|uniref:hypothetical protein n=1 Tax=Nonomuraea solani TaxID=1144553 RepID=UPI0011B05592|nr:hypothetical protein [Nonomuraea solani]
MRTPVATKSLLAPTPAAGPLHIVASHEPEAVQLPPWFESVPAPATPLRSAGPPRRRPPKTKAPPKAVPRPQNSPTPRQKPRPTIKPRQEEPRGLPDPCATFHDFRRQPCYAFLDRLTR